ncbi:MAG: hypothetical protein ABIQ11_07225 [Saprospiraceae bacterium]
MKAVFFFLILSTLMLTSCKKDPVVRMIDLTYQPNVSASNFTNPTVITNQYYPLAEGKIYRYEGQTADGFEVVEERRLNTTRVVQGITCVISNFKAYLNGNLIEEAEDWFAQDNAGNVWYFGERVDNYNPDGTLKDHGGSWEAGVDGAKAGIIMPATPTLGMKYREEYYFNEAEDEAEITGVNLNVSIPLGQYNNVIRTQNWTELEPDLLEEKYYAPGVGLIKEVHLGDNTEIVLVSIL